MMRTQVVVASLNNNCFSLLGNGGFTLETHHMFFLPTTPEDLEKATTSRDCAASFRVGGYKEGCEKQFFGGRVGGAGMLVDFHSIFLK